MSANLPVPEAEFTERMKTEILPYLDARRTGGYIETAPSERMWYEHYDTSVRPVKGIVVMLHGYTETLPKYYEAAYMFLQSGYHVRQLQLRGHGKSFRHVQDPSLLHVPDYRLFLRDIDRYLHLLVMPLNHEKLPLYLFAHSMGGALGALYLAKRPGVFPKAVLSSPMMELKRGRLRMKAEYPLVRTACHTPLSDRYAPGMKPYDGSWTFAHSHTGTLARWEYIAEYIDKDAVYQTWGASWEMVRELYKITQVVRDPEICERIKAAVLVFSASDDGLVTRRGQEQFVSRVRCAQLVALSGTKHEIYTARDEVLETYWREILSFL